MRKCKYSIDGKCTNDRVACEKCNSTEGEMVACSPLQKSILVYDEKWTIEVEDSPNVDVAEFKKGDRVYHRNLKMYGTFLEYAWETSDECDVDFETKDGLEQKHVSVNQLNLIEKKWEPREGYALTLDEIHFLFENYLASYDNYEQLGAEDKITVRAIEELRRWITNAAISGKRL